MPKQAERIQIAQGEAPHEGGAPAGEHGAAGHATAEHAGGHHYKLGDIPEPSVLVWHSFIVAAIMIIFAITIRAKLAKIPKGIGNFGEWLVERFVDFTRGIIGPGGEKYAPLVGTIFLF